MSKANSDSEKYSDREAKQRFDQALRGALKTPPKPLKDVKPKRQSKKPKPKKKPAK